MTPKDKAKELIDNFYSVYSPSTGTILTAMFKEGARQTAIIAVDEIIKLTIEVWDKTGNGEIGELKHYIPHKYWNQVKQEIEAL